MNAQLMQKVTELTQRVRDDAIEMIDLKFVDLVGRIRHVTLPVEKFDHSLFRDGVGFDGSSVGFRSVKSGDMCLIPDPMTATIDPFWEHKTLSMLCNIVEADSRDPFIGDPRSIAIRAIRHLRDTGIGHELLILPEFEFYIFDRVGFQTQAGHSYIKIQAQEASDKSCIDGEERHNGYWIPSQTGYHQAPPFDVHRNIRTRIVRHLQSAGINVKYHHHEVGASGQQEIELNLAPLVTSCDNGMLLKYIVRNVVVDSGLTATFMPKPLAGEAGSGMHLHMRLTGKQGEALFYDEKDSLNMSDHAYCFIGGIIEHASSLAAFTNPSINSYRRLVKGFEAPTDLYFSLGSRNSAIRIPKYATAPEQKRFEMRAPDATCNLYFACSAILMAGLDGIKRGIHARERQWGPYNDVALIPSKIKRTIRSMPEKLSEALKALQKDHDYLKEGGVFNQHLIDGWISMKRDREINPYSRQVTPIEFDFYYSC